MYEKYSVPEICQKLGVHPDCYEKVKNYLRKNHQSSLCYICWAPCVVSEDIWNLLWIGDELHIHCGKESCVDQMKKLDKFVLSLNLKEKQ